MLIAIEGVDKTGKTTLARTLAERLDGVTVIHAGVPRRHPVEEYELPLVAYRPAAHGQHLILDRWQLGESVWPLIFRRETLMDEAVFRHVELFLRSRGCWLVYAERSAVRLAADVDAADPPEPISGSQVLAAMGLFERALTLRRQSCSAWNYERDGEAVLDGILTNAELAQDEVAPVHAVTDEWVGDPAPVCLLVGDELGPVQAGQLSPDMPFTPYRMSCAHYLMCALPHDLWHRVALTNAYVGRTGEERSFAPLLDALGLPHVIALGNRARDVLRRQGIEHEHVFHPQYWRRFRHGEVERYTWYLREAGCCA